MKDRRMIDEERTQTVSRLSSLPARPPASKKRPEGPFPQASHLPPSAQLLTSNQRFHSKPNAPSRRIRPRCSSHSKCRLSMRSCEFILAPCCRDNSRGHKSPHTPLSPIPMLPYPRAPSWAPRAYLMAARPIMASFPHPQHPLAA